ncbi:MAG: hypothetical protein ACRCXM_02980 [Beijerinckiaceae bacterium]
MKSILASTVAAFALIGVAHADETDAPTARDKQKLVQTQQMQPGYAYGYRTMDPYAPRFYDGYAVMGSYGWNAHTADRESNISN